MTIRLTWNDNSAGETGHKVYRDSATMDVNALPAPLAVIAPELELYDDTTAISGTTYFYIVSSFKAGIEKFSQEIEISAGHRNWRLFVDVNNGDVLIHIAELRLFEGAVNVALGSLGNGTAYGSSEFNVDNPVTGAFDGIVTFSNPNNWGSATATNENVGTAFTTNRDITSYEISSIVHATASTRSPKDFRLQYSDAVITNQTEWDNATWIDADTRTGEIGWIMNETRTYII